MKLALLSVWLALPMLAQTPASTDKDSCLNWPRRETQYEFTLLDGNTTKAFITIFKERGQAVMIGKDDFAIIERDNRISYPTFKIKSAEGAVVSIVDYAVACATNWKAKHWQDLLTPDPVPLPLHPWRGAQDGVTR